jgi:predicted transposase/invertase (TIGR01784 family)
MESEGGTKLLPLKSDVVFKMVFGDRRHGKVLRAFLMSALDIPEGEYSAISLIDTHLERDFPGDKLGILDVRVETKNGHLIDVEIQLHDAPFVKERAAFYTCKNLIAQVSSGQGYDRIKRAITIAIFGYDFLPGESAYQHVFKLYDPESWTLLTDAMEIRTLELGKLPEGGERGREEALLGWLRLIRSEESEEIEMLAARSPEMGEAVTILKELSADERARLVFEAREKARMDELARMYGARAEGLAEGKAKGRQEEKLIVARSMRADGLSVEAIKKYTGLTEGEILAL